MQESSFENARGHHTSNFGSDACCGFLGDQSPQDFSKHETKPNGKRRVVV